MPLPKPPAKRADFLSRADFESQAAHRPARRAGRAEPAGEPVTPALLELSNEGTLPAAPPVAACRTFNVLAGEGRAVTAALLIEPAA